MTGAGTAEARRGLAELLGSAFPDVPDGLREALLLHYEVFHRFSARMALSADRSPEAVLPHVTEGLWAAPFVDGPQVLDVGAGSGYPSVVMALARPELSLDLCERSRRKAAYLDYLAARLRRPGLRVLPLEATDAVARGLGPWQTVMTRAVRLTPELLAALEPGLVPGGQWVLFTGARGAERCGALLADRGYDVRVRPEPGFRERVLLEARRRQR